MLQIVRGVALIDKKGSTFKLSVTESCAFVLHLCIFVRLFNASNYLTSLAL